MSGPLIVFVHVPKTAGSTVNLLLATGADGHDHMEMVDSPQLWADRVARDDWVSGHLPRPAFLRRLAATGLGRDVRLFSIMRRPSDQLRSHVNWLLEIRHRGRAFFRNHPRSVREASDRIAGVQIDSATKVIEVLREYPSIFRNRQSDVILGTGFAWDAVRVSRIIASYEMVALDFEVAPLIEAMLRRSPGEIPAENRSRYWFDPGLFDHPEVVEFTFNYNLKDELLYECVRRDRLGEDYLPELLASQGGPR